MKKKLTLKAVCVIVLMLMSVSGLMAALEDLDLMINYQGYLTDNNGTPIDGNRNIQIYIFNHPTGTNLGWYNTPTPPTGNLVWYDEYSPVVIKKGMFNIVLGEKTLNQLVDPRYKYGDTNPLYFLPPAPLTDVPLMFDTTYYIEVRVANVDGSSMTVVSPRQKITGVPYAFQTFRLDGQRSDYYFLPTDSRIEATVDPTHGILYVNANMAVAPAFTVDLTTATPALYVNGQIDAIPVMGEWACYTTAAGTGYYQWTPVSNTNSDYLEATAGATEIEIKQAGYYSVMSNLQQSALTNAATSYVHFLVDESTKTSSVAYSTAAANGYAKHTLFWVDYFPAGALLKINSTGATRYAGSGKSSNIYIRRLH